MVQAITFDLDGVYFPDGKQTFIKALEKLGIPHAEVTRVFIASEQMAAYKLGRLTDAQFWGWAAKEWQIDMTPQAYQKLLIDSYSVDAEVEDVVKSVHRQGYKTLVCSNNFPARVIGLQERFHFLNNFDIPVFSYEVGETKPSQAIFSQLIRRSGLQAGSIVFADDKPENVAGAQACGITAFHYKGFRQFIDQLRELGVTI